MPIAVCSAGAVPVTLMPHVLVVEDDQLTRRTLGRLLKSVGYDTSTAADGHVALQLIREKRPDLIVLDMRMPHLNGLEVLQRLDQSIPVIVVSAESDPHTLERAQQLGARKFLVKAAFSVKELLEDVKQWSAAAQD